MTPEQLLQITNEIRRHVSETVKQTVNGKIDRLSVKLDTFIQEDNEWKVRAQPTIDLGTNIRGFGKVFAYILGIIAALGAGWGFIQAVGVKIFLK